MSQDNQIDFGLVFLFQMDSSQGEFAPHVPLRFARILENTNIRLHVAYAGHLETTKLHEWDVITHQYDGDLIKLPGVPTPGYVKFLRNTADREDIDVYMNVWQPHNFANVHLATVGTETQTISRISGNVIKKPDTGVINHLKYQIGRLVETVMINQADAVVTISNFLRKLFRQRGVKTDLFPVIPPGVDAELFHPPRDVSATKSKTVSFIGRMVRSKGIFDLIKAFELLHDSVESPAELVFIGDGTDREEAIKVVKDKGLEEYVRFTGHVNHSEVPDFVRQSDVVVLPSWYEALGNTVVEAQSCEVPVVGCRVGGIAELLSDGQGILVEPHNPKEIAEAIQCIFSNDELAQELATDGREFVENHHALDVVRDDYVTLLKRVASRTIS